MPHNTDLINEFNNCPPKDLFEIINRLFPELTPRENQALFWLSFGHDLNEISIILGVKPPTTKTLLKRCKSKLNLPTLSDLRLIYHSRYMGFSVALKFNIIFPPYHRPIP